MQLPLSARLVSRFFSLFGFTAALSLSASAQITPIPQIQGTTDESPLKSQSVTVEGIVTGDFQLKDQFSGFFLQDAKGDGDAATSDGVFVYVNARSKMAGVDVKVGDLVRVAGRVEEFRGQTQIGRASQIEILSSENPIAPTVIELPLPQGASFENFEGMLVSFPQKLVVTAQNELPRYGALLLSAPTRLFVPTNQKPLGQIEDDAARRSFLLDDASGAQSPKPVPYLNENGTRRTGSSVANLTGILSFDFEKYRLQPTIAPVFEDNPRPQTAPVVGGTLKVAVTNLHNYWTTLRTKANPDARGAKTASEFTRQSAKTVAALRGFDADIVAIMELENNDVTAISDLVGKLNAAYGAKIYAFVADPTAGASRDPIKCGFIYKIAAVSPRGRAVAATDGIFDRFPIAQTFVTKKNGAIFTIVANHFKSKGSPPLTGDVDRGEGAWTQKRLKQAQQLLQFIKKLQVSSGDPDVLTVGDYNAYVEESPIIALRNGGLKHLNLRLPPGERYSYSFD
ncbi:MAG TPA: ExeM/NucH family extracellular endonuclease, partial [Abditibacterium sp.]